VSDAASPPSHLQNLLIEEVARLRGFLALLETEQQALIAGDVDRLMPLAAEKTESFSRLTGLGEARGRILAAESLTADRRGMESWLARNTDAAAAPRTWRDLLSLAEKARALNQVNGELIAARLANNQQALSVLLAAANQAALYGPDGQARPVGSGRNLGSV
jgi:flagella synthesis protein FlgN